VCLLQTLCEIAPQKILKKGVPSVCTPRSVRFACLLSFLLADLVARAKRSVVFFILVWIFPLSLQGMAGHTEGESKTRPLIVVHFMPWYQAPNIHGYWGWHWTMDHYNPNIADQNGRKQIASHFYPLTGPYDSKHAVILEYQTLLMKVSGIDGVLADWYGMESFYDYEVINESTQALFLAVQKAHLSFGIVYEDATVKAMVNNGHLSAGNALNYGKSVMQYMQDNWFGSNTYVKLDNRPLLLTFGPQYFSQSSDWDTLFASLLTIPLFITLDNQLAPVASGAYPWPPMWRSDSSGNLSQDALNDYFDQFYLKAAGWPHLITSAFPGFHDIYQEAGVGSSYGYLDRLDGSTFRSTLQQAMSHNPDVIQLVTWNDYGEGTVIEPTVEYRYQYLEIVQAIRDSLDPSFQFLKEDLTLPLRIYDARLRSGGQASISSVLDRVFALVVSDQRAAAVALMDSLSSTTNIRHTDVDIPGRLCLSQNFPNPFNPSTTIQFSLPRGAHVALKVFNTLGEEITTLVSEELGAGTYTTQWNSAGIASGVYYYRLQAGNYTESKRLILLR
jgi:hypothetical protein